MITKIFDAIEEAICHYLFVHEIKDRLQSEMEERKTKLPGWGVNYCGHKDPTVKAYNYDEVAWHTACQREEDALRMLNTLCELAGKDPVVVLEAYESIDWSNADETTVEALLQAA